MLWSAFLLCPFFSSQNIPNFRTLFCILMPNMYKSTIIFNDVSVFYDAIVKFKVIRINCQTFMTAYSYHFELENAVSTALKRLSILSLIFTCLCITN